MEKVDNIANDLRLTKNNNYFLVIIKYKARINCGQWI